MMKQLKMVGVMLLLLGLMSGPAFAMLPYFQGNLPPGATEIVRGASGTGGGGSSRGFEYQVENFRTILTGVAPATLEEFYADQMLQARWMPVQQGTTSMLRWIEWQRTTDWHEVAYMFILSHIQQDHVWIQVEAVRTNGSQPNYSSHFPSFRASPFWHPELEGVIPDLDPGSPVYGRRQSVVPNFFRTVSLAHTDELPASLQQRLGVQLREKGWNEQASYGDQTLAWSIWRNEIDDSPIQALLYVGVLPNEGGRVYGLVVSSIEAPLYLPPDFTMFEMEMSEGAPE